MINKKLIDGLLVDRNIPKMDFYEKIGMSGHGYAQMFEKDSMKVTTLLKIAEVLDVPIMQLLGEKTKENTQAVVAWQAKLIACNESKEELYVELKDSFNEQKKLYERLVASEEEKVQLLKQTQKEIATTKAKQSASSK